MSVVSKWFWAMGPLERRQEGRVAADNLEVLYESGSGEEWKHARIKDISSVGIYLFTDEPWQPGSSITLLLEDRMPPPNSRAPHRVRLVAKVERRGEDGVGLTFLRDEAHSREWPRLIDLAVLLTVPGDVVGLFRATTMLELLSELAPGAEDRVVERMKEWAGGQRVERVLEFLGQAQERLEVTPRQGRRNLPVDLVMRMVEGASTAEEAALQACWINLLVNSCTEEMGEDQIGQLAEALSILLPVHLRLLSTACERAIENEATGQSVPAIFSSTEDIRALTRLQSLVTIEQHLVYLSEAGLLAETVRALKFGEIEQANLTPTDLGMAIYTKCIGRGTEPAAVGLSATKV